MTEAPPLITLVGPTASGKTELAVRLAAELGAEVISADSVQVYRHFDLGSGKPTSQDRAAVPHHLIDVAEPFDPMDAARWSRLATEAVSSVLARGKVPIVCGGTFLWIRALAGGLAPAPPADAAIRARHQALAAQVGRAYLHAELERLDPASARRLAPNDLVRVSRALEVYELTGQPLSSFQAEHGFRSPRYGLLLVGIQHEMQELDRRIVARVSLMLECGWVEEVGRLLQAGFAEARPMKSVGYRQIAAALSGSGPLHRSTLATEIARKTRVFARRQRTWLRDRPVLWLDAKGARDCSAAEIVRRAARISGLPASCLPLSKRE